MSLTNDMLEAMRIFVASMELNVHIYRRWLLYDW